VAAIEFLLTDIFSGKTVYTFSMFYLAYTALACNICGGLARESNLEVDSILPVI